MIPSARLNLLRPSDSGPKGQQLFDNAGGSFVVPTGVTSISAVAIGRGGPISYVEGDEENGYTEYYFDAAGGALAYQVSIAVTPGETLTVVVDATESAIKRGSTFLLRVYAGGNSLIGITAGGTVLVGTGYAGGGGRSAGSSSGSTTPGRGAGAGGYTSSGAAATSGSPQRGGGGSSIMGGSAGGGTAGGSSNTSGAPYGGGGTQFGTSGKGGVRIIWGAGRAYPDTNTGDG